MQFGKDLTCDIFCEVVDNYGDAGVCLRMARLLAREEGWKVRLFCSDMKTLDALLPRSGNGADEKSVAGVEILPWSASEKLQPSQVVLETFGCRIPESFEKKIADSPFKPVWINVEYLSAEGWVKEWHGLSSPHPSLNAVKYYFYPGFEKGTGGVMFEKDYLSGETAFMPNRKAFLESLGANSDAPFTLFCFTYPGARTKLLADALVSDRRPVQIIAPQSTAAHELESRIKASETSSIKLVKIPMVEQEKFDALLWASDAVLIRGEESFVRAQLSGKPFIWTVYPFNEGEQLDKLKAFSDAYCPSEGDTGEIWKKINLAWNTEDPSFTPLWAEFRSKLSVLAEASSGWRRKLFELNSLTYNLAKFVKERLQ